MTFKHIFIAGLAILSSGISVNAQRTGFQWTTNWVKKGEVPASVWNGGLRDAGAFNGKLYANYTTDKQLYIWDENGNLTKVDSGSLGTATSTDGAGNVLITEAFNNKGEMNSLLIYDSRKPEGQQFSKVAITLPTGVTAGRMDIMGHAVGDVMSATGGAIFLCGNGNTKVAKIFIANGRQVVEKSKAIETDITFDAITLAQPLTDNPESDEIAVRVRGNRGFYYQTNGKWVEYARVGKVSTSSGGDVVTLAGVLFTVEPAMFGDTTYLDGFQIVDRSNNEVVVNGEEGTVRNTSFYGTILTAEKISDDRAYIYNAHPGENVERYMLIIETSGVEGVANKAFTVSGGNGRISVMGEAESVSIYNICGQAVAVNSPAKTFDVAKGIYIVTVDGKTTKVMVR